MRALLCSALLAAALGACSNSPPLDNPSAPRAPRSDAEQKVEARSLEQEQAKCAKEGKTAVATRTDNSTVYSCATPTDAATQATPKP